MRPAMLAITALGLCSLAARADTIKQFFHVTFQGVDQTVENSHGFQQFNTSLGTLTSVRAGLDATIVFLPGAPDGRYSLYYSGFAGGSSSPEFVISDTMSDTFQTNGPVDPGSVTGSNGFANYFLAFLDLSVLDGDVLSGSATGSLTYTYTPAATPEPSSLALLGTGMLAMAGAVRRRFVQST